MALEIDGSPGTSWTARTTRRASSRRRRKTKAKRLLLSFGLTGLVTSEISGFATRALSSSDIFRSAGLASAARRKRRSFSEGSTSPFAR